MEGALLKVKDNDELMSRFKGILAELQEIAADMEVERGRKYINWLQNNNNYLRWELLFDPQRLLRYRRGDIVFLDFGFNVGTEFGGLHWAVVIEDNPKTSGNVTVVPLSSLEKDKLEENLHRGEVYLGYIQEPGKQLPTYAKVNQIRAVSKIRIYKPKRASDGIYRLANDQLDKIDQEIKRLYTREAKITKKMSAYPKNALDDK